MAAPLFVVEWEALSSCPKRSILHRVGMPWRLVNRLPYAGAICSISPEVFGIWCSKHRVEWPIQALRQPVTEVTDRVAIALCSLVPSDRAVSLLSAWLCFDQPSPAQPLFQTHKELVANNQMVYEFDF